MEWNDQYGHLCTACKATYEEDKEEPPCQTCKVEYIEENADALKVFFMVRNQLIMGFEKVIDINQLAIWEIIDRYGINNSIKTFEKVVYLGRYWINKVNSRSEE